MNKCKGPAKTERVPVHLRRSPDALHVKAYTTYRVQKARPKAIVHPTRGVPLTFERYKILIADYQERAGLDLHAKTKPAEAEVAARTIRLQRIIDDPRKSVDSYLKAKRKRGMVETAIMKKHGLPLQPGVSRPEDGYRIASEIIRDFGRTKGLHIFGFGVGYAQLSFFLKNFMGANTNGVELHEYSQKTTREKKLSIRHGVSAGDPSLRKMGKFDVTYSINLIQDGVIDFGTAQQIWGNIASITKKGGKSYHIFTSRNEALAMVSREELEKRGFRIDFWEELTKDYGPFFIKLTKVK